LRENRTLLTAFLNEQHHDFVVGYCIISVFLNSCT
jgi:hypothetical protein